ncbi:MAG: hypothetical protein PWQ62_1239 [Candidatus Methanomethylophilaceae archaeon]|nr:hypothetical protein [Candidatus Methanomethylophilaceae archaeon]
MVGNGAVVGRGRLRPSLHPGIPSHGHAGAEPHRRLLSRQMGPPFPAAPEGCRGHHHRHRERFLLPSRPPHLHASLPDGARSPMDGRSGQQHPAHCIRRHLKAAGRVVPRGSSGMTGSSCRCHRVNSSLSGTINPFVFYAELGFEFVAVLTGKNLQSEVKGRSSLPNIH